MTSHLTSDVQLEKRLNCEEEVTIIKADFLKALRRWCCGGKSDGGEEEMEMMEQQQVEEGEDVVERFASIPLFILLKKWRKREMKEKL